MNILNAKLNDEGYRRFFTNGYNKPMVAMQFARANYNLNASISNPHALADIKNSYYPGPIHFANTDFKRDKDKRFFDLDIKEAYATFLINYKKKKFNYYVGGNKEYYHGYDYWKQPSDNYMVVYKIGFAVKTSGREQSKIYRRWFLKTKLANNIHITNNQIAGYINIPHVDDLPNRFIKEVEAYDGITKVHSVIKTSDGNAVYINDYELEKALKIKNNKSHPYSNDYKFMVNSSTGYLSHADKVLYYTMINQIRSEIFKLIDYIDEWNAKRPPGQHIDIVAANTDGITIYADIDLDLMIESFLEYEINRKTVFKFLVKEIYTLDEAHFTPNDIRRN